MNLQDFIHTSLIEMVKGVASARDEAIQHGATIGSNEVFGYSKEAGIITGSDNRPVSAVDFDIALSEGNTSDTKGGIGVFLGSVGIGSQGASHGEFSSTSRVRFSVPIVFPGSK